MKYITLLLSSNLIFGCSSSSIYSEKKSLEFEMARKLNVGTTGENDVIAIFGMPAVRTEHDGYTTFTYNDPESNLPKLFINLTSSDAKVLSVSWIPYGSEKVFSIDGAKAYFPGANFKKLQVKSKVPHVISDDYNYIDEKSGVRIAYTSSLKGVEAISWYNPDSRLPSSKK